MFVAFMHTWPHTLPSIFEGRPVRREDSKRLLDPVQQALHSKLDIKVIETKKDDWLLESFGNPDKGFLLVSRAPYSRSSTLPLKDVYPDRNLGPFALKTPTELSSDDRKRILRDYHVPVMSDEEISWSIGSALAQLRDASTNNRVVVMLGWSTAAGVAHWTRSTSKFLRQFQLSPVVDALLLGGMVHFTMVYRHHQRKADEAGLAAVKDNPHAAVSALELQRAWNLQQRNDEGFKGKLLYTEAGDYRFEYPLFLSTRIKNLKETISSSERMVV